MTPSNRDGEGTRGPSPGVPADDEGAGCLVSIVLFVAAIGLVIVPFASSDIAARGERAAAVRMLWRAWPVGLGIGLVYAAVESRKLRRREWSVGSSGNFKLWWPLGLVVSVVAIRGSASFFGAACGFASGFLITHTLTSSRRRRIQREAAPRSTM